MTKDNVLINTIDREQQCLKELKARIKENHSLDKFQVFFTDEFLLHFVKGKKYNCEVAYEVLENYVNIRTTKLNKFFKTVRPSTLSKILNDDSHLHILKCTQDQNNRLVIYDRAGEWDPRAFPLDDVIKKGVLIVEEGWNQTGVELNGAVVIFDIANLTFPQVPHLCSVSAWQKAIDVFLKSFPLEFKEIHLVHDNFLVNSILKLVLPLAPHKIRQRFHVHGNDMTSLHKFISPEVLPKSLGGYLTDEEAFQDAEFFQKIREKDEYYRKFIEAL